jgi:hypothetical protein
VQVVDDPSLYQLKFFVVWQAFADDLKEIFKNGDQDAQAQPVAERLDRYSRAILTLAKLLYAIGQRDLATHFHDLGESLHDRAEGRDPPLFKVEKKRGRQPDTSEIWRLRTDLCVGIQYLIASGMERDKAITLVVRKYRTPLQKLLRPGSRSGSDLKRSIRAWLKEFEADTVSNVAQDIYKDGMQDLEQRKASVDATVPQQLGLKLIEKTAMRAARALKT